jgi:hypothetical protein
MKRRPDLQPIETKFKGHKFRSRIEARWAVFFEALGLRYEYEVEGFKLPSGGAYLPDFLLPDMNVFVEVKPNDQLELAELRKLDHFALDGDCQLLLILGSPTSHEMLLINRCTTAPLEELQDEYDQESDIVSEYVNSLRDFACVTFGPLALQRGWTLVFKSLPPPDEMHLQEAFLKAKQARFEFGEEG